MAHATGLQWEWRSGGSRTSTGSAAGRRVPPAAVAAPAPRRPSSGGVMAVEGGGAAPRGAALPTVDGTSVPAAARATRGSGACRALATASRRWTTRRARAAGEGSSGGDAGDGDADRVGDGGSSTAERVGLRGKVREEHAGPGEGGRGRWRLWGLTDALVVVWGTSAPAEGVACDHGNGGMENNKRTNAAAHTHGHRRKESSTWEWRHGECDEHGSTHHSCCQRTATLAHTPQQKREHARAKPPSKEKKENVPPTGAAWPTCGSPPPASHSGRSKSGRCHTRRRGHSGSTHTRALRRAPGLPPEPAFGRRDAPTGVAAPPSRQKKKSGSHRGQQQQQRMSACCPFTATSRTPPPEKHRQKYACYNTQRPGSSRAQTTAPGRVRWEGNKNTYRSRSGQRRLRRGHARQERHAAVDWRPRCRYRRRRCRHEPHRRHWRSLGIPTAGVGGDAGHSSSQQQSKGKTAQGKKQRRSAHNGSHSRKTALEQRRCRRRPCFGQGAQTQREEGRVARRPACRHTVL